MNTDESPPGNGKGGRQAAYPAKTEADDAAPPVTDKSAFRKYARIVRVRYCLEPDIWAWLIWHAAANDGGEP